MNTSKRSWRETILGLACAAALLPALPARADILELSNGDHYSGTLVSLNQTNLEFRSEIQGVVKIPRDKVARITFREISAKPAAGTALPLSLPTLRPPAAAGSNQSAAAIAQIRKNGVDAQTLKELQEQLLGQSSPEVTSYFNKTVAGLMTGSLNVEDIRAQARKAIADLRAARKDMGGEEGEVLAGYLQILQSFVDETDKPASVGTAPAVNPPK